MKNLGFGIVALCAMPLLLSHAATAQEQFAAGTCVSWGGPIFKVIGPGYPGYTKLEGNGPAHSPLDATNAQLAPAPCPGPRGAKNVCFQATPEQGNDIERAIRHFLIFNEQRTATPGTVRVNSIAVGQPRQATDHEVADIGDADMSHGVVDARIDYDVCTDDDATILVTHYGRQFACYIAASTQQLTCSTVATSDLRDATTQTYPKY